MSNFRDYCQNIISKDDEAYYRIKEKIITLEYPPNYALRELDLSAQLEMSRTPIRIAIARLINDGLVIEEGPKTNLVSDVSPVEFMNIYHIRRSLEELCVTLACYSWEKEDDLLYLDDLILKQKNMFEKEQLESRHFLEIDREYHLALAGLTNNNILIKEIMRIYDLYWRYNFYSMFNNRYTQIAYEHSCILDSIKCRNKDKAIICMREHLSQVKDEILLGIANGFDPIKELKKKKEGYYLKNNQ